MTKQVAFLLLTWLSSCSWVVAQPLHYSKAVLEKIRQVEQHLAGNIRTPDDKDWTIQERMKHYRVHGVSIAVVHNYQIEWAKAYGWADTLQQKPLTTETRFQAGSISKSLNGVGLLTLVQDKKMDLYADINHYLTTWKFPYDSLAKGKTINTANLLSHTAGLSVHGFLGYSMGQVIPSLTQILNGQKPANSEAVRSLFEPGLKYQYSGGGTMITQQMLLDIIHQPYDQYMWERVLKPMGMTNSSYTQPPVKNNQLATGYGLNGKAIPGKYNIYPEQAAAGLWTTPSDLARYIIETQLAYQGKSSKVLTSEMTHLRLTPYVDSSAALGVFIVKKGASTYFNHGGADIGFRADYYGSLTTGDGLVVMINSDRTNILDEVVNSIARVYHWKDFYKPITKRSVVVAEAVLDTYVGVYELEPQWLLTITKEQGQLVSNVMDLSQSTLLAETKTKFFSQESEVQIDFIADESGKITKLLWLSGRERIEAKKLK